MQEYLRPSEIIDFDNSIVCSFVEKATEKVDTPKDKILAIYLKVRDHRAALRRQPRTPKEHLEAYERMGMTKFSSTLQDYSDLL